MLETRRKLLASSFALVPALATVACNQQKNRFAVSVMLDFGPAGRPPMERTVSVGDGSTVFEALQAAFPVDTSGR